MCNTMRTQLLQELGTPGELQSELEQLLLADYYDPEHTRTAKISLERVCGDWNFKCRLRRITRRTLTRASRLETERPGTEAETLRRLRDTFGSVRVDAHLESFDSPQKFNLLAKSF